jgi:hypothetical protein
VATVTIGSGRFASSSLRAVAKVGVELPDASDACATLVGAAEGLPLIAAFASVAASRTPIFTANEMAMGASAAAMGIKRASLGRVCPAVPTGDDPIPGPNPRKGPDQGRTRGLPSFAGLSW